MSEASGGTGGRLAGRRLALGVTGSIAAYKSIELLRMLQAEGADVRVLMTRSAVEFIGTLTLETLSRHPVDADVLALQRDGKIGHIETAHDVQAIVVAPATAHWLGAMANGLASDPITAACLAASVPVVVAPAMDGGMYAHPATQANVARLQAFGYRIVEPEEGLLASGMTGKGRLAKLDRIVDQVVAALALVQPAAIRTAPVQAATAPSAPAHPMAPRAAPVQAATAPAAPAKPASAPSAPAAAQSAPAPVAPTAQPMPAAPAAQPAPTSAAPAHAAPAAVAPDPTTAAPVEQRPVSRPAPTRQAEPRVGLTVVPVTRPAIELTAEPAARASDSPARQAEPAAPAARQAEPAAPAARQAEPAAPAARQAPARTDLSGLHVVVTAGGTAEPIDPVRFVGNRSSGKMGVAVAQEALDRGAAVTLILGNASVEPPADAHVARAETTAEMQAALMALTPPTGPLFDVLVMAAAVADFRPRTPADRKIARSEGLALDLEATPDLLAETADRVRTGIRASGTARPVLVGFAAETGSFDRVRQKLKAKGVDLLVANDVSEAGSGFGTDTNRVTIYSTDAQPEEFPLLSKREVAEVLLDRVVARLKAEASPNGVESIAPSMPARKPAPPKNEPAEVDR